MDYQIETTSSSRMRLYHFRGGGRNPEDTCKDITELEGDNLEQELRIRLKKLISKDSDMPEMTETGEI